MQATLGGAMSNPHGYEAGFTVEQHRDELIDRLSSAIKQIAELRTQLEAVTADHTAAKEKIAELEARNRNQADSLMDIDALQTENRFWKQEAAEREESKANWYRRANELETRVRSLEMSDRTAELAASVARVERLTAIARRLVEAKDESRGDTTFAAYARPVVDEARKLLADAALKEGQPEEEN